MIHVIVTWTCVRFCLGKISYLLLDDSALDRGSMHIDILEYIIGFLA